jgi:general secretion pathway protein L
VETRGLIRRIANADFADVLGVALRGDVLAVAHVRKRVNVVRVIEIGHHRFEGPADSRVGEAAAYLRSITARAELEPSRVAVAIDRAATLIATVAIPAAAASNAGEAVRYDLDRLIPVPPDSLYWCTTTRPLGTIGERVGVTVFAAPKPAVEEAAEMVREAGLPISSVTVEPVALTDYLGLAGVPLAAVATRSGGREFLTLCADGLVASSRHADRRKQTLLAATLREIEQSLPERSGQVPALLRARALEEGEQSLAAVAPADLLPVDAMIDEAAIVAIGAALGIVGEGRQSVNLLPQTMVQTAAGWGLRELALSGSVAAMGLLLLGSIAAKNLSIDGALGAQIDDLEPRVEQALRHQDKNAEMLATVEKLETKSRSRVLVYLQAVTDLIPKTAYLTTFRYREDKIELDGIADKASDLISILEASPYFAGVEFTAPTTKYLSAQERFSLRMRLEQ